VGDLYRDVTALLRTNGYQLVSGGKGSHEKWHNEIVGVKLIVPRNLKSKHTANGILKSARIAKKL
jgi:predicted RNA binding protein YcfA (HicA-like mRNA interferase family)